MSGGYGQPPSLELLDRATGKMKKLREATEAYLHKKMRQRRAKSLDELRGKSAYEQKRIDVAKEMLEKVRGYDKQSMAERDAVETRLDLQQKRRQAQQQKQREKKPEIERGGLAPG